MQFLADESCDFAVVRALRREGHDVFAVSEFQQQSIDADLMDLAFEEARILITEDKDFGWLAFVGRKRSAGVILIRYAAAARQLLGPAVVRLAAEYGDRISGCFVVLRPGSVRFSRRAV